MAENTKIEWADHTFNPWRGCTKVAPGCVNCYAERDSKRNPGVLGVWGPNGTRVLASDDMWRKPAKWNAQAQAEGRRMKVFCASLADVFEDWGGRIVGSDGLPLFCNGDGIHKDKAPAGRYATIDDARAQLFRLIDATPWLDWLILTKRPENVRRMWPENRHTFTAKDDRRHTHRENVWLGTSVSEQETADRNVPHLLQCRDLARVLFVSAEPLLGSVRLDQIPIPYGDPGDYDHGYHFCNPLTGYRSHKAGGWIDPRWRLDWVIAGGESGGNARPTHPAWGFALRDQCRAAGVPFFWKQWGEWGSYTDGDVHADDILNHPRIVLDIDGKHLTDADDDRQASLMVRVGKKAAGRLLAGRTWDEFPTTNEERREAYVN